MNETPAAHDEQDRALVRQYLDGDRNAAGSLVDRYQRTVFNLALRMLGNLQDAEDVTQTVFGNAFASISSADGLVEGRSPTGEGFGGARLREVVRKHSGASASELVRGMVEALKAFAREAEPHDDLTMLVAQRDAR